MTAQPAFEPPVIATDESRLALAFQRGEAGAYEVIFRRYSDMVRRHCERILSDPDDAQDAVQETFLRVYNRLDSFNGRWLLEAWIKRIATNICLDKLRQRSRRSGDSAPEVLHGMAFSRAAEDPEHVVIRRAEIGRVLKRIEALPRLQREAVVLRDVHDLPHRDVAAVLQITEARARVLIHRAHKTLRGSRSAGLLLSFGPRLWRRFLRDRFDGSDPVTACVYQASSRATDAIDSAGLFFKHGGGVAQGIASVAAAAVVGAGAALPATNGALSPDIKTLIDRAARGAVIRTDSETLARSQPASGQGRNPLAQVTAATTSQLEMQVMEAAKNPEAENAGEEDEGSEEVSPQAAAVEAPADLPVETPPASEEPSASDSGESSDAGEAEPPAEVALEEPSTTTTSDAPAEEPAAEEPTAEEPTAEEPTAEEPTAEEPAAEEPTAEEPTAEEPAAEEPAAEEPAAEEPAAETPSGDTPTEEPEADSSGDAASPTPEDTSSDGPSGSVLA
jgi:RNA polymerase sigma factor (sigma-70 family)